MSELKLTTWIQWACDADYNARVIDCTYRRRFTIADALRSYTMAADDAQEKETTNE